ncbi:efflux RND transporter periplasmic adaptor subunit [Mesorhizobium sp. BAC0120]|uniref:HlyD family secretion protein n=1 Tax=Mesorhizobium sp. BAC0120 TaxID=3090670 RepID=UPI00298D46B7|nr:efflux RND transporter periplasmic adaptor subunit [Mesorhizobium sp. BAC0120]MDW6024037.1 efflux RND transporter periplasmic adaptor subunit [Mesorhizobium sp. BAC0120]
MSPIVLLPAAKYAKEPQPPAPAEAEPMLKVQPAPPPAKPVKKSHLKRYVTIAAVLIGLGLAGGGGYLYWRHQAAGALPEGIVSTNGRVEATQVDIATKIAGRVIQIVPHEGDIVEAGSVAARLDQAELEAALHQTEAEAQRARQSFAAAQAVVKSREAELTFANQELQRASQLLDRGYGTVEKVDQRRQEADSATAALKAANAQVDEARAAIAAYDAQVDRLKTNLADATITSPVRGRVQYRLVEPGAVLSAGGRIATVLDLSDVYMTIFVPASVAGRLTVGDEARVVVDAVPEFVFPAAVSFVAPESQFTPKTVETQSEREQLYFRVKLHAPPDLLKGLEEQVKAGLRGIGYVRVDPAAVWPAKLSVRLPPK